MSSGPMFAFTPRVIAFLIVCPLVLAVAWIAWRAAGKSRGVQEARPGVEARAAGAPRNDAASGSSRPSGPRLHDDDGRVIELREPRQAWKANIFWGLLFGLLLVVPALFAPQDVPAWKKYGSLTLGFAWLAFMGRTAVQNRSRVVRCDRAAIEISQPSGSRRILLSDVKKITRSDDRQKLRDLDDAGRPRYRTKPLDTMAPMVYYVLRGAGGEELLRLDKGMEPGDAMRRFLERMENVTGGPISDER